jgi:hypothetical protein
MANAQTVANRLFQDTMSPLVLGGPIRPGHAIGVRLAFAIGDLRPLVEERLLSQVEEARIRRARMLAPVDALPGPRTTDWAIAAALHDILQSVNPGFDRPLRREAAVRILESAALILSRVAEPATVREALSRHTWFARTLDIARADTRVSWWTGSSTFRGVDPPARLQLWTDWRRVKVVRTRHPVLEVDSLAVDRSRLKEVVGQLLGRSPLTDLGTCARVEPRFSWQSGALALVGSRGGRRLASRALDRMATSDVDAALGRATRELLRGPARSLATPVLALLAERATARALDPVAPLAATPSTSPHNPDVEFAQALGALVVAGELTAGFWRASDREKLDRWIEAAIRTAGSEEARALLAAA